MPKTSMQKTGINNLWKGIYSINFHSS